ncbi:hypothetical protein Dsin_023102 [Dipteronia sinensis]|uniref:Uncharacterized protein n=1 Tax=Dipteronia sinensis TaxID=43782 RepID=A0AAE0A3P9_9ROSI|nr:hypothetical protein Dsin_023102 [Dipteronia sinensis]
MPCCVPHPIKKHLPCSCLVYTFPRHKNFILFFFFFSIFSISTTAVQVTSSSTSHQIFLFSIYNFISCFPMLRGWFFSGFTKMLFVCKETVSLWVLAVFVGFSSGFFCTRMMKRAVYAASYLHFCFRRVSGWNSSRCHERPDH